MEEYLKYRKHFFGNKEMLTPEEFRFLNYCINNELLERISKKVVHKELFYG